ncbi:MAG: hypothetical protein ACSHXI_18335 [Hoeflea sp.]|uniref:hypothetical protein n=1 Tax=Hoeflea sp. TaxID=1940281 RepID=UPI003EF345CA
MKKIALISASVLALGAASIAADADGVTILTNETPSSTMSYTTPVESAASTYRGHRIAQHGIKRSVRLVSPVDESVNSCEAANWPYYPIECLKRVETAGL